MSQPIQFSSIPSPVTNVPPTDLGIVSTAKAIGKGAVEIGKGVVEFGKGVVEIVKDPISGLEKLTSTIVDRPEERERIENVKTALYRNETGPNAGDLVRKLVPNGSGIIDIVKTYPWTISKTVKRDDIPYIRLKEYYVDENIFKAQARFYGFGLSNLLRKKARSSTASYDELFPKGINASGWQYIFPHFPDSTFDISTVAWKEVDLLPAVGDVYGGVKSGISEISSTFSKGVQSGEKGADVPGSPSGLSKFTAMAELAGRAAGTLGKFGLQLTNPIVGIYDRPRLFSRHNERSVTVEFPLFNTVQSEKDALTWERNREFLFLFTNQNLFNKKDFITGLPPVFYEVWIPGQYFSIASCVTDLKVKNLGNLRVETTENGDKRECIVPDAYQVSITLTDMTMASRNLHNASENGDGKKRVTETRSR